jgi:tetratricopeptide (TPR) repeat protein
MVGIVGLLVCAVAAHADENGDARAILEQAKAARDRGSAERSLTQIDQLLAKNPKAAYAHYVRGWILAGLERREDALAAYTTATKLDPKLAEAWFEAGVTYSDLGKDEVAIEMWEKSFKIDPKAVNVAYNLGQAYYNKKDYKRALDRWNAAHKLAPDDFDAAKKILQTHNALGDEKAAKAARDEVFRLWRTSTDPRVRGLTQYIFDQFDVGKVRVMAFETFDPKGDLYYVYTFVMVGEGNKRLGSVNLESSAVIREMGKPYIIGMDRLDRSHGNTGIVFEKLPRYAELKPIIIEVIKKELARPAK